MTSRPRVLFLTPGCFDKGGVSRYSRYQMTAFSGLFGRDSVRTLSVLGPDPDAMEDPVKVRWFAGGTDALAKSRYMAVAMREAVSWKPHVVHAGHVNLGGLALAAGRVAGSKTILNIYGCEVWSPMRWDARQGLSGVDCVMSDCHATAEYATSAGLRRGDIPVIWDCVDLERFSPGKPDPAALARYSIPDPDTHFNLMTLGRVSRAAAYKGYARLIEVFASLAPRYPALRLIIGGSGDLLPELRSIAESHGVTQRVVFTGSIAEADLPDVYRSASLFSLITERGLNMGEGLPLTPLEAMACGAPILVGSQDGSREAVVEGINGYVLEPLDLPSHARAIETVVSDPSTRTRLAAAAISIVRERFSYETFETKHAALYERLLA